MSNSYEISDTDVNLFISVINKCLNIVNNSANNKAYKIYGTQSDEQLTKVTIDTSTTKVEIVGKVTNNKYDNNIESSISSPKFCAVYPKYYVNESKYYQVIKNPSYDSTYYYIDGDDDYGYMYYQNINIKNNILTAPLDVINNDQYSTSTNIYVDVSIKEIENISNVSLYNYKIKSEKLSDNSSILVQYAYCINDPFACEDFQVPVYGAFPVLSGLFPIYTYAYNFEDYTEGVVTIDTNFENSSILDLTNVSLSVLSRDKTTYQFTYDYDTIKTEYLKQKNSNIVKDSSTEPLKGIGINKQYKKLNTAVLYGASNTESITRYTIEINVSDNPNLQDCLLINGSTNIMDSNNTSTIKLANTTDVYPYIFSIILDTSNYDNNEYCVDISISNPESPSNIITGKLVITNDEDEKHLHKFKNIGKDINNNMESFMLLRANPKLSGNIKLVIDSNYNLYIDTFKSSDVLNNSKYRKYPISAEGNYPRDIRQVFKTLPISELYKTSKNSLNAHKIYTDFQDQYETIYEYGAETNTDVLYSENMKILAPLHIGKNIPEFFAIFRYDGVYNTETYNNEGFVDIDKFRSLIKDAKVIKTIDLRQYTSIGQYLNNYKNMIQNYGYGQCGLQFIEQDNYQNSEQYRQGKNIWKGILVKQGILTEQSETSYFANKILNDSSLNNKQELFNAYIQSGFERHGLLYPNIINLEYMFNDTEYEEYTMHRYFGLYLYENDFINYDYVTDIKNGNNLILQKYNSNGQLYTDDLKILRNIFNTKYADRLFYAITNNNANRIYNEIDVNKFLTDYVKNSPEQNIIEVNADKLNFEDNQKSFITLHIKKPLQYGEHIKIILMNISDKSHAYTKVSDNNMLYNHIVYEIIASNDERLRTTEYNINPYVTTHICEFNNAVIFKRISFYSQDILYPEIPATINEQLNRINACIDKFKADNNISVSFKDKSSISIISNHIDTYLQHIAASDLNAFNYDYMHISALKNNELHICTTNIHNTKSLEYISTNILTNIKKDDQLINSEYQSITSLDSSEINNNYTWYSYVECTDSTNIKEDNISYFNKSLIFNMKAMSPITEYYDSYYIPFSNYMFETLGWRHSSIVKFISPHIINNMYVLYNDISDKLINITSPLVYTKNNTYETVYKLNIQHGYLSNNIINPNTYSMFTNKLQELVYDTDYINNILITNPFNSMYNVICSDSDILLTNNNIRLYKPKSAQIAVMGISNIKDIDTNVETKTEIHRESRLTALFKENEIILTDESDLRLQHAVMYEVVKGVIKYGDYDILQGSTFIIISNVNGYVNGMLTNCQYMKFLTDTTIKVVDKQKYQDYNYSSYLPEIKLSHFFNDINDIYNSDLMYPIVPTVNCAWKSTGLYIDDNNILDIHNLTKDYKQNNGHFTESIFTPDTFEPNQYVINKLNNRVYIDNKIVTFKDAILNKLVSKPIKKLLIDNVNIDTAICHYNSNIYSLEFIYYGIKFNIKFNDKIVNTYLHLDSYDNYHVFILNEYDSLKTNEMYISDSEEFILLVNHQFYIDYAHEADNNIKDITHQIGYAPYSTYAAPISVDFMTLSKNYNFVTGYMNINNGNLLNHIDIQNLWSSWFIECGNNNYIYSPLENIMTNNNYISFMDFANKTYYNINSNDNIVKFNYIMTKADGIYNHTFQLLDELNIDTLANMSEFDILHNVNNQSIDDTSNNKLLSTQSINEVQSYAKRILYTETIRDKQQRYLKSITDNIDVYVIPENSEYKYIQNRNNYNPLMFNVTIPNYIKYNYGYFTPNTNNMVDYNIDDIELSKIIDTDLLCANTNIIGISKILNYTGNKVFERSDNKIKLNYFTVPERSLLSSTWDNGYYRLYTSETSYNEYDGQLTGIDDKSFFGSRCMILRNPYIQLDTWSYDTANDLYYTSIVDSEFNENTTNSKCLQIEIKLSNVLYHFFINNKQFTDNWKSFKNAQYTGMKNYINYTMTSFYNMNSHIDLQIFKINTKLNDSINIINHDEYNSQYQLYENYKSNINFVNNEYILTIIINDISGINIHPVLKIYRK